MSETTCSHPRPHGKHRVTSRCRRVDRTPIGLGPQDAASFNPGSNRSRAALAARSVTRDLFEPSMIPGHRSAAAQETFPSARKSLLFERVPVNVKSVKFPQARRFAIQELDPAHPLHALIPIEVWHHEPERVTMLSRKGIAVMPQGENRRREQKIRDCQVCPVVVLAMDHHVPGLWPQRHSLHQFCGENPSPTVVEPAPARDRVQVPKYFALRQLRELFPRKPQLLLYQAEHAKIPRRGTKDRHRAHMQHRPLEGQRLSWGQPPSVTHLTLPFASLVRLHE